MASEDGAAGVPGKDEDSGVGPEAENAGGQDGPDAETDDEEQSDNPLAHVDTDKAPSTGKGMFNDPKADPLWNPSLEPEQTPGSQGIPAPGADDDDDGRRPETD
ncbi:MAG TPA: hypothetical protein VLI70_03680 [Micrococcaceae bacterium]|nr:hypothetical protein [Micrococcaceae bacterium]